VIKHNNSIKILKTSMMKKLLFFFIICFTTTYVSAQCPSTVTGTGLVLSETSRTNTSITFNTGVGTSGGARYVAYISDSNDFSGISALVNYSIADDVSINSVVSRALGVGVSPNTDYSGRSGPALIYTGTSSTTSITVTGLDTNYKSYYVVLIAYNFQAIPGIPNAFNYCFGNSFSTPLISLLNCRNPAIGNSEGLPSLSATSTSINNVIAFTPTGEYDGYVQYINTQERFDTSIVGATLNSLPTTNAVYTGPGPQAIATGTIAQSNTISGLRPNTTYYLKTIVYNLCDGQYYFANAYTNEVNSISTCNFSTATINNLEFGNSSNQAIRIHKIDSNLSPTGYIIKMNTSNSFTPIANNSAVPTADNNYSGSGEQVVYAGSSIDPNIYVRNLQAATEYYFKVYAYYEGCASSGRLFQQTGFLARKSTAGVNKTPLVINYTGATTATVLGSNISLAANSANSTGLEYQLAGATYNTTLVNNGGNYELKPGAGGTVWIDITALGDATYETTTHRVSIDIQKIDSNISIAQNLSYVVNDGTTSINLQKAISTNSSGLITYTIIGDALGSTLSGANNAILNVNNTAGIVNIQATQAATDFYNAKSIVFPVLFSNGTSQTPTLIINDFEITSGETATLNPQGSPNGSVISYTFQSNPTGSSISGGNIFVPETTFTAGMTAGTSVVRVSSAIPGSTVYNTVDKDITVTVKDTQTITFNALSDQLVGGTTFTLTGTASSGLDVAYVSSNTAVATVSGNTVTIVGAGTTNITAGQAGDVTYVAAADVTQSLTVTAFTINEQTVSVGNAAIFCSGDATVSLGSTQNNVQYTLRNNADNTVIGSPLTGNGSAQSFPAETLTASKTYNVLAERISGGSESKVLIQKPTANVSTVAGQQISLTSPSANTARVSLASSETGITYYLRDNSDNSVLQVMEGTGSPITFPDVTSSSAITYNVYAQKNDTNSGTRYEVQMDGDNDYLYAEGTVSNQSAFSIEMWAYIPASDDTDVNTPIFNTGEYIDPFGERNGQRAAGDYPLHIRINGGQMYVGSRTSGGTEFNSTSVSYPKDQWIHLAATKNSAGIKLYIDGTEVINQTQIVNEFRFVSLKLGRSIFDSNNNTTASPTTTFGGKFSTIRYWRNVALNPAGVTNAMNAISYGNTQSGLTREFVFGPSFTLSGFDYSIPDTTSSLVSQALSLWIGQNPDAIAATRFSIQDVVASSCNSLMGTVNFDPTKTAQNITFTALANKSYGDANFDLSASSDSGLTSFTYSSSNTDVATISGSTVTIVGLGTTTITANQAGDVTYLPSTATQTLTVVQRPIAITTADNAVPVGGTLPTLSVPITTGSLATGDEIYIPITVPSITTAGSQTISVSTTMTADSTFDPIGLCTAGICILNSTKDTNVTANYTITTNNTGTLLVTDPNTGVVWDGSTGVNWNDAANWSGDSVPSSVDITIPQTSNMPNVGTGVNGVVNDMVVQSSTLTIPDDSSVTVRGNLNNEGTITVSSVGSTSGVLLVEGDPTGTVTYVRGGFLERDSGNANNNTNLRWSVVSPPVVGQKIKDFVENSANDIAQNVAATIWAVGYYDDNQAVGSKWVYYTVADLMAGGTHENTTFQIGTSYAMARNTAGSITFTGTLQVTTVNKSATASQWNAIGNPFTAFIPANQNSDSNFINDNLASFDPLNVGVYIWDNTQSRYVARSLADATGTSFTPGQGFFVRTTTGVSSLIFDQSKRSTQPGAGNTGFGRNEDAPSIQLFATLNDLTIDTNIKYFDHATLGLDPGYDVQDFGGDDFDLYTKLLDGYQDINFTIQSLPIGDYESMIIPIGVTGNNGDEITFTAEGLNLPAGIGIYLEDRQQSIFEDLTIPDGHYKVTLNEDLDGTGRFYLHTTSSVLSTGTPIELAGVHVFTTDSSTLRVTGIENEKASVTLYNILGVQVFKENFDGNGQNDLSLPKLKTGIYIVHLQSENGRINKKIIIE
jgi:hypothetical protein